MFRALVELGKELENRDRLPPPGFYYYKEPIRWRVTVLKDGFLISPTDREAPRPFSGRTSGVQAHLLTDEAAYALGANKDTKGKADKRAAEKHAAFIDLLEELLQWPELHDDDLAEAIDLLLNGLKSGWQKHSQEFEKITTKEWVEFVPAEGALAGKPLFEHPRAVAFWVSYLEQTSSPGKGAAYGECAICGAKTNLIGKIPLGVKLVGNSPLHSFNQASFPSFVSGASPEKVAHIGLCFRCADTASRAFNYLSQSDQHRKRILSDKNKRDALTNQIALYWVKAPAQLEAGEEILDAASLSAMLSQLLQDDAPKGGSTKSTPRATLAQMEALLQLPWQPREAALHLDNYGFYLAVLSPNVGRIALREWINVSLENLKQSMARFLEATRIISPWGDKPKSHSIAELLRALDSHNPNHLRGLLRTAYLGHPPPPGLKQAAIPKLRNARILGEPKESWRYQALIALIKLVMFYGSKEAKNMEKLNPKRKSSAYLSGRLLATLEEAQKRAQGFNINRTLVEKFYGAASTAPAATFGMLMRTATVSHLQKAGSLNPLVEEIISKLDDSGGFPKTLTLEEQAEFALGFYHQRADFKAKSKEKKEATKVEVAHE